MWTMGALEGSFKLAREELRAEQSESQLVHGRILLKSNSDMSRTSIGRVPLDCMGWDLRGTKSS